MASVFGKLLCVTRPMYSLKSSGHAISKHRLMATSITKTDLVQAISLKTELRGPENQDTIKTIIDALTEVVMESVAKDHKVTILGFGSFERVHKAARKGRNPQTGEELFIAEKNVPAFRAGKAFKEIVAKSE